MPFTKQRQEWETRYVSDYVLQNYPNDRVQYRVPLGKVPESLIKELGLLKAIGIFRPYRPEVDALVITKDTLVLIEGKIFKVMDGLSKLPVYKSLIPETPELELYKKFPVRAVLVTPKEPVWAAPFIDAQEIFVDIFRPDWLEEYYQAQERYWTPEERMKRLQRKEVLKGLGFK